MDRPKGDVVLNFCYLSILFLSLFNFLSPIPISLQLFFISMSCIYIGSRRGIIIQEKYDRVEKSDKEEKEREKMTVKDALLFLVYGSIVLLGLYFAYRIFDQNLLNLVLSFHFTIFGFLSLVQLFCYHIDKAVPEWEKILVFKRKYHLNLYVYSRTFNIAINRSEVIAGLIAIPATFGYFFTKHWLLNNLLGIAFSICGIESLVLPSFQIGFVLLWGLFFYDVFWVYGTDVMVTVAKAVDAPIKLLLPVNLATHKDSFSMLGLGDIIVPGVFIALCLKYDVDKAIINFRRQGIKEFDFNLISTPYFNWCLGGYALGMVMTYNALLIFNHAQPALFFLVPCCTLSVLLCAMKNKEMKTLFEYSEEHIRQSIGEMALAERYKEK